MTPRMLLAHTLGLWNFAAIEADRKMRLHSAEVFSIALQRAVIVRACGLCGQVLPVP